MKLSEWATKKSVTYQTVTSFCARIYGQRRCKRKTEKIINELNASSN